MTLRTFLTPVLCLTILATRLYGQVDDSKIRLQVLQKRNVGKEYKFVNPKDSILTFLKYLGQLTTKNGVRYNIVTSTWIFGLSHKATNSILVFDKNNKYLGNYFVSTIPDLPEKIKGNNLIFTNAYGDCDSRVTTRISFAEGIPKDFFRKCKGDSGDIYSFSKEE